MLRVPRTVLIATALAACEPGVDVGQDDGFGDDYDVVTDIDPSDTNNVDLLLVVDNSGSMAEEQAALTASARDSIFGVFESQFGERPNLHVAVVSTDVGAGPYNISGCAGDGDNGVFQNEPRDAECTPPDDPYIIDVAIGDRPRTINYEGAIHEAFNCIAPLGIDGCGFEQPLEAMRRALDGRNPQNDGFLRGDSLLAIAFLTDEDDCSASNTDLFDTSQNELDDPLGPLSSFRCFEFGVQCEPDNPREPGARRNCISREDSLYVTPVGEYVKFVKALRPDPTRIVVATVAGPNSPIAVGKDMMGNPELDPSCESEMGQAAPGVRLSGFASAFRGRHVITSICDGGFGPVLRTASSVIAGSATGSPCLLGALQDVEPDAAGLQVDCRVYDAENRGTAEELRTRMPACGAADGALPCFDLVADEATCGHTSTGLKVQVTRDAGDVLDTHVLVRCKTG